MSSSTAPPAKRQRTTSIAPISPKTTKFATLAIAENPLGVRFRATGEFKYYSVIETFGELKFTEGQKEEIETKIRNGELGFPDITLNRLRDIITEVAGQDMCDKVFESFQDAQWGDVLDFIEYRGCGAFVLGENGEMLKSYGEFGYEIPLLIGTLLPNVDYYGEGDFGFSMYPSRMPRQHPLYDDVHKALEALKVNPTYEDETYGTVTVDTTQLDKLVCVHDLFGEGLHWATYEDAEISSTHFNHFLTQMDTLENATREVRERDWVVLNMLFRDRLAKDTLRVIMEYAQVDMELDA